MDFDLIFSGGVVLVALAIPSLLSAWTNREAPRMSAVMLLIGGSLIVWAMKSQPATYSTFSAIPDSMVRVVGRYIN